MNGFAGRFAHARISSLSAQQLRAAEVRAKLGGVGGFAPGRAGPDGGMGQVFSVNIYLGGQVVERITTSAVPVFEGELAHDD